MWGSWDPVVLGGWKGGWKEGQEEGQEEEQKEEWEVGQKLMAENGGLSLIRWRLVSRVERRESFRVRRVFRDRFGWF
jgi:hypothetical protein